MVVCKFFQQGNCRYGQNCRFDHVYASKFSYQAPQVSASSAPSGGVTDEQLINQVQSDIQAALKGGQWILSSYSPFKEKPNFPGISDLSMEEARLFIYEAKASNNLDQAVAYMNNIFKETRYKYEQLLQPNSTIIRVLKSLYKGEVVSSPFNAQSSFGSSSSAASIFRSAAQDTSVFGQTNTNTSPFGQNASNSIFGPNPVQNTQTASFGQDNAKSIFAQASQNIFGQSQPTNVFGPSQTSNIFDKAPDTAAKSIFAQANQNVFQSNPAQSNPASIFATAAQSVFTPSPFSQQKESDPFSNQQQNSNPFAGAAPIFQTSNQQNDANITIYSNMNDLSPSDMESFNADEFKLGFIPEIPPPQSLCF